MENVEKVMALLKAMEAVEKDLMGMFSLEDLAEADEQTTKLFKGYFKLYAASKELMLEQAKTLDNTEFKLNQIGAKVDAILQKL